MPVRARSQATRRRGFRVDLAPLTGAILACLALMAADAWAQVSGSVSLVSDYRYRGVSLSHNDPAAQAAIVYDDPQGWYAGAFASTVKIGQPTSSEAQGIFFAGYAGTTPVGTTWEAGVVYSGFTGAKSYAYHEFLVGAAHDGIRGRLHYSPNYYGRGYDSVYGELDTAHPLLDRARVLVHVGALWTNARDVYGDALETVFDARVGIVIDLDRFTVQLSWVGVSASSAGYGTAGGAPNRNGPVLSVSWLF